MRGRLLLTCVLATLPFSGPLSAQSPPPDPDAAAPAHVSRADGTASLAGGWDTHVTILRAGVADAEGERVETPGELPLLAELRTFVGHLGGGPPPKSSGEEGAEVVAAVGRLRDFVLSP